MRGEGGFLHNVINMIFSELASGLEKLVAHQLLTGFTSDHYNSYHLFRTYWLPSTAHNNSIIADPYCHPSNTIVPLFHRLRRIKSLS